jgi:hypothetical protein
MSYTSVQQVDFVTSYNYMICFWPDCSLVSYLQQKIAARDIFSTGTVEFGYLICLFHGPLSCYFWDRATLFIQLSGEAFKWCTIKFIAYLPAFRLLFVHMKQRGPNGTVTRKSKPYLILVRRNIKNK